MLKFTTWNLQQKKKKKGENTEFILLWTGYIPPPPSQKKKKKKKSKTSTVGCPGFSGWILFHDLIRTYHIAYCISVHFFIYSTITTAQLIFENISVWNQSQSSCLAIKTHTTNNLHLCDIIFILQGGSLNRLFGSFNPVLLEPSCRYVGFFLTHNLDFDQPGICCNFFFSLFVFSIIMFTCPT